MADYGTGGPDLDEQARIELVFKRWQDVRDGLSSWRDEARESYGFDAGQQWSTDDLAILREQNRPSVTFDRGSVIIDAVAGLEVGARQAITYFPREQGDVQVSEIESAAAQWVLEQCHGEDQESEAFRDALVCGIGATEMLMDYEQVPDGKIVIERRDPLKCFPDAAASKKGLSDARFMFYADWMDNKEIEDTWPDKYSATTPWDSIGPDQRPQNADLMFLYKDTDTDFARHKDQSLVIQYQCFWREPYYRVLDPQTGELVSIEKGKFTKIRKAYKEATGKDLEFVKQAKRVYYRGFYCGRTELEYKKSPCQEGFTFKFITAKRDRNRKMWFGLWRPMKDPQRWANKWLSQILHIINSNAKGGAFVETNALKDPRKAEDQWASSNPLIELNEGGIEKIKERTPANTPTGLDKLMNFAFESMPFVTGVNLEALGLANREQAGVLEAQRRKAAYGILAPIFDALRLYRKEQGKMLLFFIREFISDGRLIKVLGPGGKNKYLPLVRKPDTVEYDLIVDQSPHSPDFKEKTWEAMKEILPVMMKEGIPIPPSAFDFAPLPSQVAAEFKQLVSSKNQVPPQIQKQMQDMQQALQEAGKQVQTLQEENTKMRLDKEVDLLKIRQKHADSQSKIDSNMRTAMMEDMTKRANAILEAQSAKFEHRINAITAHLDRDSEERKHLAALVGKASGDDSGGGRAAVVIDPSPKIVRPLLEKMSHMENGMKAIHDKVGEAHATAKAAHDEAKKPRRKIGKAVKQADGSYLLQSVEKVG